MELFGVGLMELLFIVIVALIVLGPGDIKKTALTIGRMLNRVVQSPQWQSLQQNLREVKGLPAHLMREAGMEDSKEALDEIRRTMKMDLDPPATPPAKPKYPGYYAGLNAPAAPAPPAAPPAEPADGQSGERQRDLSAWSKRKMPPARPAVRPAGTILPPGYPPPLKPAPTTDDDLAGDDDSAEPGAPA